ncbi:MAG: radical SAM protein [bacterium]|nr:radical SAM protein [bacterium]
MDKKAHIYIGDSCDLGCRFCTNKKQAHERKRFISSALLKKKLKKYAEKKYDVVDFLGGEVTLYPRIEKIIRYASDLGYKRINLISHGLKFADPDFVKNIASAGNVRFCISVESHKEKTEDFLISVQGGFRKKIKGLYNLILLRKQGVIREKIFLMTVINKLNYKTMPETVFFYFRNFGIKDFRFRFIMPVGKASVHFKLLVPTYTQVLPYIARLMELAGKLNLNISYDGIPSCILRNIKGYKDFISEAIDRSEEDTGMADPENKDKRRRKKTRKCRKCVYNMQCTGLWKKYLEIHGKKEFKPVLQAV